MSGAAVEGGAPDGSRGSALVRAAVRTHRLVSASEVLILAGAIVAGIVAGDANPYWIRLIELVFIYAIAGMGLDLVSGYCGQFSLGHSGLFAIGAYTSAIAWTRLNVPFLVCVLLAVVISAATGVLVGGPSLRIGGLYLALVTLAFAFIVANIANDAQSLTNGPTGIGPLQPALSKRSFDKMIGQHYILAIAILLGIVWVLLRRVTGSRWGRALIAVRESEALAQAIGVRQRPTKIVAFVISAGAAGLAGALYAHLGYISPHDLTWQLSVTFLVIVFLGGIGTLTGAILGAAVVIVVPEKVSGSPDLQLVLYGVVLVVVMVLAPRGMFGAFAALGRLKPLTSWRARITTAFAVPAPAARAPATDPAPDDTTSAGRAGRPVLRRRAERVDELRASGVSKSFQGVHALRDASLSVRRGELLGLIGPNGSGKTTFLNCLGGQVKIDAGEILLGGSRVDNQTPALRARRGLFRTFQQGALCAGLSCFDNVMLGGHLLGRVGFGRALLSVHMRHREETALAGEAATLLEHLSVPREYWSRRPGELPYGLRRLVEIGVTLMGEPQFLLLDEPAAGLVDEEISRLDDVLRELLRRGMGIVLVEHHLQLVMNLAERVVVLDGGSMIATGGPAEVVASSAVKRAYLGEGWASEGAGAAGSTAS